jgi:hypothetical protein
MDVNQSRFLSIEERPGTGRADGRHPTHIAAEYFRLSDGSTVFDRDDPDTQGTSAIARIQDPIAVGHPGGEHVAAGLFDDRPLAASISRNHVNVPRSKIVNLWMVVHNKAAIG